MDTSPRLVATPPTTCQFCPLSLPPSHLVFVPFKHVKGARKHETGVSRNIFAGGREQRAKYTLFCFLEIYRVAVLLCFVFTINHEKQIAGLKDNK